MVEEKKVETPAEETPVEAPAETVESEAEEPLKEEKIDYDAELEAENKRAPDLKKAAEAYKKRHEKKEEEPIEGEVDDEDKPITRKDLDAILAQKTQQIRKETYSERIVEIASGLASSDAEAKLIVAIINNRQWPESLTLKEIGEEAYAIANRKRLLSQNSELARALRSKETASKETATTFRDGQPGSAPKMSSADAESYKRAGFVYDGKDRLWKKKMPNGKTLAKDPKTKQTRII